MDHIDRILILFGIALITLGITIWSYRIFNKSWAKNRHAFLTDIALMSVILWGGATVFLGGALCCILLGGDARW